MNLFLSLTTDRARSDSVKVPRTTAYKADVGNSFSSTTSAGKLQAILLLHHLQTQPKKKRVQAMRQLRAQPKKKRVQAMRMYQENGGKSRRARYKTFTANLYPRGADEVCQGFDYKTFTANLYPRGADEVCQGFEHIDCAGLVLVAVQVDGGEILYGEAVKK
jgi:hypothetical protein